ncbi:hypothetical protein WICPIJ_009819 [Wickerhamomyces pijperi]|uniref:Uncharacterized protein n=1 Tax=Wickerhamomyces pijperi TaxID=599730 RepID=A0A9P8TCN8_WICPI|nr:hypothetical protein WICPIJ_009819 [Wickerhamomyces pijperi]
MTDVDVQPLSTDIIKPVEVEDSVKSKEGVSLMEMLRPYNELNTNICQFKIQTESATDSTAPIEATILDQDTDQVAKETLTKSTTPHTEQASTNTVTESPKSDLKELNDPIKRKVEEVKIANKRIQLHGIADGPSESENKSKSKSKSETETEGQLASTVSNVTNDDNENDAATDIIEKETSMIPSTTHESSVPPIDFDFDSFFIKEKTSLSYYFIMSIIREADLLGVETALRDPQQIFPDGTSLTNQIIASLLFRKGLFVNLTSLVSDSNERVTNFTCCDCGQALVTIKAINDQTTGSTTINHTREFTEGIDSRHVCKTDDFLRILKSRIPAVQEHSQDSKTHDVDSLINSTNSSTKSDIIMYLMLRRSYDYPYFQNSIKVMARTLIFMHQFLIQIGNPDPQQKFYQVLDFLATTFVSIRLSFPTADTISETFRKLDTEYYFKDKACDPISIYKDLIQQTTGSLREGLMDCNEVKFLVLCDLKTLNESKLNRPRHLFGEPQVLMKQSRVNLRDCLTKERTNYIDTKSITETQNSEPSKKEQDEMTKLPVTKSEEPYQIFPVSQDTNDEASIKRKQPAAILDTKISNFQYQPSDQVFSGWNSSAIPNYYPQYS